MHIVDRDNLIFLDCGKILAAKRGDEIKCLRRRGCGERSAGSVSTCFFDDKDSDTYLMMWYSCVMKPPISRIFAFACARTLSGVSAG